MNKLTATILIAFVLIFQGHAMAAGKLINEISALDKPERFKPIQVNHIVKKYFSEGISKAEAKEILASEGFKVTEEETKQPIPNCPDCESTVVVGRYDHKPILSLVYDYGIAIEIGFRNGGVAVVRGWYVKNAY
ncbi:hypothetical protein [Ralstonia pseudosolanacearum]|uniref:hypothetical protein n=1 Tax=Ralstonia pseudosolanacearum TaxID=1310165 RepID=UPI0012689C96|nr:hypothetical protein [Ralstonia pseudosolanacearum]MDO3558960.1 hypothetical protein [Ralstonia pseudosolanacearum]MDO3578560.1 hypothetical protein [Ralstonia pseudosolanacearum]MDO3587971.1 hypothetical protein [Ralstonia pseudosolanacearum]